SAVYALSLHDALPICRMCCCAVLRPAFTATTVPADGERTSLTGASFGLKLPVHSRSRSPSIHPALLTRGKRLSPSGHPPIARFRSEEHTSELQSRENL